MLRAPKIKIKKTKVDPTPQLPAVCLPEIQEHQITKHKLELLYNRLEKVLESTSDGFISFDREWRYTYINRRAEELERHSRDELLGKNIWELFPGATETLYCKKYHEAVAKGITVEFEEYLGHRWYNLLAYPLEDGLAVFYRDITDRKLLEERKDEFIRMASHEMKTPITTLKLYTELLQKTTVNTEQAAYLEKMLAQAERLNKLVTNLLNLSKIEDGKLDFNKEIIDLGHFVQDQVEMIQKGIQTHHLVTKLPRQKIMVSADPDHLSEVIINLINNAVKYSPDQEEVIVSIRSDGPKAHLEVTDFGIGIEPEYQKKIFTRFYQISDESAHKSRNFMGLGIGLYISSIIARNHRGTLTVKSAAGQGSTFTLTLNIFKFKTKRKSKTKK